MASRNVVWWVLFLTAGIWLQMVLPGVDMLIPGLILAMQERRPMQLACVFLITVLIQEGLGTLAFGACVLWYLSVMLLMVIGHWLFSTRNLVFMILLGVASGVTRYAVTQLMVSLQNAALDNAVLLEECGMQAVAIPVFWKLAELSRRWGLLHGHSA